MAQATIPASVSSGSGTAADSNRWRWAGGFGLAHVVIMLGAFAVEGVSSVEHGTPAGTVLHTYGGLSVPRVELASYVEAMAFLPLLAALVVLIRLLSHTEVGRVAGQVAFGIGVAYVASTCAVGFPPLTAAVFAAHHGVDAGTLATVNDLRNYGFLLQVALSMAFTLALGIAALAARVFRLWAGYGGVLVGTIGLIATPFAHNALSSVWLVWWVGLSVLCLKGGPKAIGSRSIS